MKLLYLLGTLLLAPNPSVSVPCLTFELCECESNVARCVCENHQDLVLRMEWSMTYFIKELQVKGCGAVTLQDLATEFYQFDLVHLSNISSLVIKSFSFSRVENILSLVISDVDDMEIQPQAFVGPSSIAGITLKNVHVRILHKQLFRDINRIDNFFVKSSSFGIIENRSLDFVDINSFTVSDTSFDSLQTGAIIIHSSKEVSFKNTRFHHTNESSFEFSQVEKVEFKNCNFGKLASNSIRSTNVECLTLSNSHVSLMESNALIYVDVSDKMVLQHNTFEVAEKNSLIPTNTTLVSAKANHLRCNCNISWIWQHQEEVYRTILNTSNCIANPLRMLSSLTPYFTSDGICINITTSASPVTDANSSHSDMFLSKDSSSARDEKDSLFVFLIIHIILGFSHVLLSIGN